MFFLGSLSIQCKSGAIDRVTLFLGSLSIQCKSGAIDRVTPCLFCI